jgi:hypothetical protein
MPVLVVLFHSVCFDVCVQVETAVIVAGCLRGSLLAYVINWYLKCVDRVLSDDFFFQWLRYTFLNKNCPSMLYEVESAGGSFEFHDCFAILRLWNVCSEWCGGCSADSCWVWDSGNVLKKCSWAGCWVLNCGLSVGNWAVIFVTLAGLVCGENHRWGWLRWEKWRAVEGQ